MMALFHSISSFHALPISAALPAEFPGLTVRCGIEWCVKQPSGPWRVIPDLCTEQVVERPTSFFALYYGAVRNSNGGPGAFS